MKTIRWTCAVTLFLAGLGPAGIAVANEETARIAFVRVSTTGSVQLWTRSLSGERRLIMEMGNSSTPPTRFPGPKWSPDGQWLLFYKPDSPGQGGLYKVRSDGSGLLRITGIRPYGFDWSPDGTTIVYSNGDRLYVMDASGRGTPEPLPDPAGRCNQDPAWSPDGSTIAFTSFPPYQGGGVWASPCVSGIYDTTLVDVYAMPADGSGSADPLTNSEQIQETDPRWSPNGNRLLVDARKAGTFRRARLEILRWNASPISGTPEKRRVVWWGRGVLWGASWSPDASRIVFSLRPGNEENTDGELFAVRTDGTRVRQLTSNRHEDLWPDWEAR